MTRIKLNAEERAIAKAIENDEFLPVKGQELQALADAIAGRRRDMSLTIRVNSNDISRIKKMAKKKGIAYQSYISEVIHKVAESLD